MSKSLLFSRILSLKEQVCQIKEGGLSVLKKKIKTLVHLINFKLMEPLYLLAIRHNIDWKSAHLYNGQKQLRKFKTIRKQSNIDWQTIYKLLKEAILPFEKYIARKPYISNSPAWVEANGCLKGLYWHSGKLDKCIELCKRVSEGMANLAEIHQLQKLDIEFIPRSFAIGSVGVYENLDVYIKAGLLGLRPQKKLVMLVAPNSEINNPSYLNYWSSYITIVTDPFLIDRLTPLEKYLTIPLHMLMRFDNKVLMSHFALGILERLWNDSKKPPLLTLSEEDNKRGRDALESFFGIPRDAWFVCLHAREPGWRDKASKTESFRNTDIETYLPAVRSITAAGGWVIRMGDKGMTPLPSIDRVIDYAHSEAKSDWMDVFLCAKCQFIVGTASGLFTLSSAFGVPTVLTNFLPIYAMYSIAPNNLFIPRLCRSLKGKRLLTFKELFTPPLSIASSQDSFKRENVEIIENTSDEIDDVVKEMLARQKGEVEYSDEDDLLQKRFHAITAECGRLHGIENEGVNARMEAKFLKKHQDILCLERSETSN